jgi:predicted extracellular nuclease
LKTITYLPTLLLLLVLFVCLPLSGDAQTPYRVAFYNLENLFDYEDDTTLNDEEYLPESMRNWTAYRYREKLHRMAKAVLSIGEWEAPAVVGVCEVENKRVLQDLVATEVLRKLNYGVVHFESPDRRGIDVGLLYRKDVVDTLYARAIEVSMPENPSFTTRDILHVKASLGEDTLHFFVNHWPSRYGGQQQSEPRRLAAAAVLRQVVDSLLLLKPSSKIIVMGDLNDTPANKSVEEVLGAGKKANPSGKTLQNLMLNLPANAGSHRYRGEWSYLDQLIVSAALCKGAAGLTVSEAGAQVHRPDFLLETDERFPGETPFRTFIGMKYHGGFSDHLPVYLDLVTANKPADK